MLLTVTELAVAEGSVRTIKNSPEVVSGQVSITFGIASAANNDQLADALKQSDERMYLDKTAQKEF